MSMALSHVEKCIFALLVGVVGCAIIPEVKNNPCVNLIFCTLKSNWNYCLFERGSDILLEKDRNGWNIANEQRNRSIVNEYGDYECVAIRSLQESDAGYYTLYMEKDGRLPVTQTFSLTESVLNNLLNASNFNVNKSKIDDERLLVPVYWRRTDTELPEALRLTAVNGTKPNDFSLALVVTAQDLPSEKPTDVTTPTAI